jgi:hypothetical protein
MAYNDKPFLTLQCDTACFYVEYPGIYGFMSEKYRHQEQQIMLIYLLVVYLKTLYLQLTPR